MKVSIKLFAIALIASVTVSSSSFAATSKPLPYIVTETVDETAKGDWMLLAKKSEYLMNKNSHLSTAKEWLEQSIEIKETAYNLELMGDYYQRSNNEKEAVAYYIRAIEAMKVDDAHVNTEAIQTKIVNAEK
ncbi:MAG: hypothetical protein OCD76_05255 [Reichenbachiella sp.]